jgi:hypothetical protein
VTGGSTSPATLSAGSSVTLGATLMASCSVSTSIVEFEVFNSSGTLVFAAWWDDQSLSGGTGATLSVIWPTPSGLPTGTYTLAVESYATGGFTTPYGQNTQAATFTVS